MHYIRLCLRINDSGLFAWIRLTALSLTYFIECFTTTFLLTHHSLLAKTGLVRMIDEDEVHFERTARRQ